MARPRALDLIGETYAQRRFIEEVPTSPQQEPAPEAGELSVTCYGCRRIVHEPERNLY